MPVIRIAAAMLGAALLSCAPAAAQEARAEPLDAIAAAWAQRVDFSGSILVSEGGETLFMRSFGLADQAAGLPVGPDTAFAIASLSKGFTTVLTLQWVAEGRLSLDDSLADLLPGFDAPYAGRVTLRHLLQNRSGLPHTTALPGWFTADGKRALTPEVMMAEIARQDLQFEPGADYLYSNLNYYLLGRILDRAGGAPFEDQLAQRILDPLGMDRTGHLYAPVEGAPLAVAYLREDGVQSPIPVINPSVFRAAAGMSTTAADLAEWGEALLDERLLDEAGRAAMYDPERPMSWTIAALPVSETADPLPVRAYNGGLIGYDSMLTLLPEQDAVIIILNNNGAGYGALVEATMEFAAALYGGAED